MKKIFGLGAAALLSLALSPSANAETVFSFGNITGNSSTNAAAGEAQLQVGVETFSQSVTDVNGNSGVVTGVAFRFFVNAGSDMSITDIYFEDGAILALTALIDDDDNSTLWGDPDSSGGDQVDYSFDSGLEGNLPGGNQAWVDFQELAGYTTDPDSQGGFVHNGVAVGEEVTVVWTLQNNMDVDDVIAALNDGGLRIGIHVQGFGDGGSESFVANYVPVPPALAMGLLGLVGVAAGRKRYTSKTA